MRTSVFPMPRLPNEQKNKPICILENQKRKLNLESVNNHDDESSCTASNSSHIYWTNRQDHGLLSHTRQKLYDDALPSSDDWMRPYWLGCGLFLVLFPFWILDTLKDPVFGILVAGKLETHQPSAKLFSVVLTLGLVCFLEYVSNAETVAQHGPNEINSRHAAVELLDLTKGNNSWSKMNLISSFSTQHTLSTPVTKHHSIEEDYHLPDRVSGSIFATIGMPYCLGFGIVAYILQFNTAVAQMTQLNPDPLEAASPSGAMPESKSASSSSSFSSTPFQDSFMWHVLGYFWFAGIESFGSISVATFWSYANSALSVEDAEALYGLIVAIAQMGAIGGSTMVSTYVWSNITLLVLVCLVIILHVLIMTSYCRRFDPATSSSQRDRVRCQAVANSRRRGPYLTRDARPQPKTVASSPTFWSGLYLVLKYNYVLLIFGVSCLYEVSLTCLNYQMTLLGWNYFASGEHETGINFTRFMGHYGQMVNIFSLLLSAVIFPFVLKRYGLRWTLRIFPSLLLIANLLAFGILPGNLTVLFVSMATLKAITYSIHDPSKEFLYLPTSNSIKFKSKFWIDVVGVRFAKAIGSSINTLSGSVDQNIHVASAPSLLTSVALWWVCYRVGGQYEDLIATNSVVGLEEEDPNRYTSILNNEHCNSIELEADDNEGFFEDPAFEDPMTEDPTKLRRSTEESLELPVVSVRHIK